MEPGRPIGRLLTRVGLTVLLVALVCVAGVAGVDRWRESRRTELQQALALTPVDSVRFSWTDWVGVRREAGADDLADLLSRGFDLDLTSASAMGESAELLEDEFGFSPLTVDWELLAQSEQGSALLLGLPDDADIGLIEDTWASLGYERPTTGRGVWVGGDALLATIADGRAVSPQFAHLGIDRDRRVVVASDDRQYVETAMNSLEEGSGGTSVELVAAAGGDAVSGVIMTGDLACRSLAMSQADPVDQATAEGLIAAAGEVSPISGLSATAQPDGGVRFAMSFESTAQARVNADSRAALAAGPAPGQGGTFEERFTVESVTAEDRVVILDLSPTEDAYVLSDLSAGPVLFATC